MLFVRVDVMQRHEGTVLQSNRLPDMLLADFAQKQSSTRLVPDEHPARFQPMAGGAALRWPRHP
jgi:hypothetical protein